MNLQTLFSLDFWFKLFPDALSPGFDRAFFIIFSLVIISGAVAKIVARHKKDDRYLVRAYRMLGNMLIVMGLLGMMWFFFTYEGIYILGSRFWFLIWLAGLVAWVLYIVRYTKRVVPKLREEAAQKNKENEYLPRKKRRK